MEKVGEVCGYIIVVVWFSLWVVKRLKMLNYSTTERQLRTILSKPENVEYLKAILQLENPGHPDDGDSEINAFLDWLKSRNITDFAENLVPAEHQKGFERAVARGVLKAHQTTFGTIYSRK